ncbi:cysteine desulfurase family protein [Clostridium sp. AM58-1XD]|uniref:cysteine desulfurase family protein n=1 Tax=Clostridium sp. AM58-1XD TaxID=2292307 RepID=UPI000E485B02|nr:cysteine desulfurase family protein [Clostridium sp. AM58-1XD]RGY98283.1 cysteine desulfurase [Clostridium sp. AM58-1XD]
MNFIYFDNSATTQVDDDIAQTACDVMVNNFGNPSSPYHLGREALHILTRARQQVAMTISAPTKDVYFTSGGTESNNLAVFGVAENFGKGRIVTTAIEHNSIIDPVRRLGKMGFDSVFVTPYKGVIRAEDVIKEVNEETILVSVMAVNNETGEILPVEEIVREVRRKNPNTIIHCDCVQAFGKMPFKLYQCGVDLLSASAHKIHGPKGVGALYVREGTKIVPRRFGGGQESRIRPGTEPVPLAAAFGQAAEKAVLHMDENNRYVKKLKERLINRLRSEPGIVINSPEKSLDYILNISAQGIRTDEMLNYLRLHNVYVSGSSACSAGAVSHVIQAMNLGAGRLESVLRIGFSKKNTLEETDTLADIIIQAMNELPGKEV